MKLTQVNKQNAAAEVVSHEASPVDVQTDPRSYARIGWFVVAAGFGGFLLWATTAPLDRGVPMPATVVKEGNRKAVQHLTGGMVHDILVKDGDVVRKDQVLVRMNNVQAAAQVDATRAQFITARATEARLQAERDGAKSIAFPAALAPYKNDPDVVAAMALQNQLFSSRRMALESELTAIDENIAGLQMQIKGLQESRESKRQQIEFLKEQLTGMRDLAKEGYVARNRLLDLERTYAQLSGEISQDIGNIGRAQRQVMELKLRKVQRSQSFQQEVRSQLADVQREAEGQGARLQAQTYDLANTEVKAPADGIVVNSTIFTRGGIVGPGAKMMDIVPADDQLVAEGQLEVHLVDKVHVGLPVEMIFSAFNTNRTPHIPGEVIQVSADRSVDERTGHPYYKVRARVTPEGARIIAAKKLDIQPGMPVEIFVKTGERSMMSYLLKPIVDRARTSMSED
ncbi:hemolysin D [Massilia sp. BSC265]|nr:hemolysin D [Massilia sp. BSC265]